MYSTLSQLSFPRISPARSYRDRIYGMVDVYVVTSAIWRRLNSVASGCSYGAQATYIPNNAETCNPKQYGIKLVGKDPQDAYAAWWRQRQAYKARLAPPVGRVVRFEVLGKINGHADRLRVEVLWGYQTGVAAIINDDKRESTGTSMDLIECMTSLHGDIAMAESIPYKVKCLVEDPSEVCSMDLRRFGNLSRLISKQIGLAPPNRKYFNGFYMQQWARELRRLDLRGSPRDNSLTREVTERDPNEIDEIPKGALMPKWKRIRGGGDLHYGNIGWWRFGNQWRTVCIDFGWHYVCNRVYLGRAGRLTEQYNDCI
jgi:hypothetical protein